MLWRFAVKSVSPPDCFAQTVAFSRVRVSGRLKTARQTCRRGAGAYRLAHYNTGLGFTLQALRPRLDRLVELSRSASLRHFFSDQVSYPGRLRAEIKSLGTLF